MNETKKNIGIVYQITHPDIEDKCYVGQTLQSLSTRWATIKKNAENWAQNPEDSSKLAKLYKAIIEHGADNMQIDELEAHELSHKDELIKILKEREAHFIKTKKSLENGWNNLSKAETAKRNRDRKNLIMDILGKIIVAIIVIPVFMAAAFYSPLGFIPVLIIFISIAAILIIATKYGGGGGGVGFSSCGGCGGGGGGGGCGGGG